MTELPSVEVLETVIVKALEQRDMEGVTHALRLIAVQDPHRAQTILDTINVGAAIGRGE